MEVVYEHSEPVAEGIRTFWFRPTEPIRYEAGQYTELHLPHTGTDERGIRRWFTLSSSPTEPLVSITTKLTESPSSFKKTLRALQPGDPVTMAAPMGDFVLPKHPAVPIVFVAAGIGVTPVRSMVKQLSDRGQKRNIMLLQAAHHPNELAFTDLFKTYGLNLTQMVTTAPPHWPGATGHLSAGKVLSLAKPTTDTLIYLSGPEPLIEKLYKDLQARGISSQNLIADYFHNYPAL